ncbi:MAG TPA: DUF1565 domain-containing protein [Planctomycetota bacterium]|nr:DUF1565 domain-containing protein [Planctomycetota bacterium]
MLRPTSLLLAALLMAPRALAGHLYVDPVLGNDANPGTTPELPFKHILKALQVGGTPDDAIHLAPGEYSAASGEHFPLSIGATSIYGDGGSAVTIILGTGNDILVDASKPGGGGTGKLELDGVSLLGGRTGLRVNSASGVYQVQLQDVVIDGMSQDGIEAHAVPTGAGGSQVNLGLYRTTVGHCLRGLTFQTSSPTLKSILVVQLSRFESNAVGLNIESSGNVLASTLMSRFTDHSLVGVRSFANGGIAELQMQASLVAANAVGIEAGGLDGESHLGIRSCTIAHNGIGVSTDSLPVVPLDTVLAASLVWDNTDDLALAGPVTAEFNDVSDGDFAGADGNISADPLFRDAAAGDYRLSWGSPAIEAGGPMPANDLLGNQRPTDGDFDAVAVSDIGCLEFVPLDLISPPQTGVSPVIPLGGQLRLQAWGESGAAAHMFVSPSKPIAQRTKFGLLFLDLAFVFPLGTLAAGPVTPGVFEATVPVDPSLSGVELVFQTLVTSSAAPKGKALSNLADVFTGS